MINTVCLIVLLPNNKFVAWAGDLSKMIKSGGTTVTEPEWTIGRLKHTWFLVPLSRHFLNGLRRKTPHHSIRFSYQDLKDLELWSIFLQLAKEGISMNFLTLRIPSQIAWSDSCPFG